MTKDDPHQNNTGLEKEKDCKDTSKLLSILT